MNNYAEYLCGILVWNIYIEYFSFLRVKCQQNFYMNISLEYLCMNDFVESDDVSPPSPDSRNVSPRSEETIVYVHSDPEDTEYDTSDSEPLAKYRTKN